MCLIIHRVGGSNVPNDVLDHNRKKNADGFGLAWREKGVLHHKKWGPKDYEGFHKKFKELDRQPGIEYTAHFRMATHGPACKDLSHPFTYEDKKHGTIAVFHNGIIDIDTDRRTESDTSTFVKQVLSKMGSGWWKNPAYRFLVEQAIGYSRLLIMTPTETIRLNEKAWSKVGGIMYSTDPGGSHTTYKAKTSAWTPKGNGAYASPATKAATGSGLYVPGTATGGKVVPYTPPKQWTTPEPKSDDSCDYGYIDANDDEDIQSWMHEGHRIESLSEDRIGGKGEDISVEAVCVECGTIGEVYVIEGTTFIDVVHGHTHSVDDDDEDDIDSATMRIVYAN